MKHLDPTLESHTTAEAPTWDMEVVFPSLTSPEFEKAFSELIAQTESLRTLFVKHNIAKGSPNQTSDAGVLDEVLRAYNEASAHYLLVEAYVSAFVTTDTTNELAQAKDSELDAVRAERSKLYTALCSWVGTRNQGDLSSSQEAEGHRYWIECCAVAAKHTMSTPEEELAADLAQTGTNAWSRLHSDVTSQMRVDVGGKQVPMPVVRNLAYDADRSVRKQAYEAELAAWKTVEVPCAAAMNGIKGEQGLLAKKRGWNEPLDIAVFNCNMDRVTLEAMMGAARDSFPTFRRYMRAKAKLVNGDEMLSWIDLYAPVGEDSGDWSYQGGADFVAAQFDTFSSKMGDFARRAVRERWIDAKPADNKVGGAFCMGLRDDESRLLQTWKPSFGAVGTLAHELGHAYHNLCQNGN
ncbi:MAG: M3 family metallopeptidase, partial [bacterium]